jgi:hypothetical protein
MEGHKPEATIRMCQVGCDGYAGIYTMVPSRAFRFQQLSNELVVRHEVVIEGEDYSDGSCFQWRLFTVKHM